MDIEGSVALVTGGASGLGEAALRSLVAAGMNALIADMNAEKGEAVAAAIGDAVGFARCDVTDADAVQAAVDAAAAMGPLRVVIHCAGTGWAGRTINRDNTPHDPNAFELVVRVNTIGTFNVLTRAAAKMAAETEPTAAGERGVIVNTASVAAFDGQIGQLAYAASKASVVGMTLPAARDLAPVGIRVCTIAPGLMDTPLLGLLPDDQKSELAANVVFPKRLGSPEEFAQLAESIVRNSYMNGETIRLDGAIRMPPKG